MSERTSHLPRRVTWSCTPTKGGKKGTRGRCTSLGSPEGARNEHVLCLTRPRPDTDSWRRGETGETGEARDGREGRWLVGRKRPSFAATRPGRHRIPPPRTLPRRKYVRESGDTGSHARTEALETVLGICKPARRFSNLRPRRSTTRASAGQFQPYVPTGTHSGRNRPSRWPNATGRRERIRLNCCLAGSFHRLATTYRWLGEEGSGD